MTGPAVDVDAFRRDGYVHLRGFVPPERLATLGEALETATERDPGTNPLTLDTMRFASNLFYAGEELQRFLSSPELLDVLCPLKGPDLWVRWDQAVWKGPDAPWFPWHQDNGYTELDVEHIQVWVAVTSMSERNGGLRILPGRHIERFAHHWIGGHVECFDDATADAMGALTVEAAAGDVVVFSSWLPHATTVNRTGEVRLAYVAEYLRLDEADTGVRPPHFVAARNGRPAGDWVNPTEP